MTVTTKSSKTYLGLDVSKESLSYALVNEKNEVFEEGTWVNQPERLTQALDQLIENYGCPHLCVFEPTGGYERELAACLMRRGLSCHQANTTKLKNFAKSQVLAKTDRLDASSWNEKVHSAWLGPSPDPGDQTHHRPIVSPILCLLS